MGIRDVMWNPRLDVISLAKIDKSQYIDELALDVFGSLFLEQVKEIQRLVVETNQWPPGQAARDVAEWTRIIEFEGLVELVVLVEPYTRRTLVEAYETGGNYESFENRRESEMDDAAENMRTCLVKAKEQWLREMRDGGEEYRRLDSLFPARIRVVGDECQVLDGE